jgi:cysteine synthase A
VVAVTDEDAFSCARRLAHEEGIIAGVSSGAAMHAALGIAAQKENAEKIIVVILADTGERYVTTSLFQR